MNYHWSWDKRECQIEQKIIQLQNLVKQLPEKFADPDKQNKIPAVNAPI